MKKKILFALIGLITLTTTLLFAYTCPNCDGEGEVICYSCNGEGVIPYTDRTCTMCNGAGVITCPTCRGRGEF